MITKPEDRAAILAVLDQRAADVGSVACAAAHDELKRLWERISAVLVILRLQARWDWPIPEGQGLPDGETWAHYQDAMGARRLIEILEGTEAADAAKSDH